MPLLPSRGDRTAYLVEMFHGGDGEGRDTGSCRSDAAPP